MFLSRRDETLSRGDKSHETGTETETLPSLTKRHADVIG